MPPKKQTPRNAFYYYMLDFKNKQGRNFRSMKDVADAAGPYWDRLSKDQRKPFEDQALCERNNMKMGKYTSEGVEIEELERQEQQELTGIQNMKDDINRFIKMSSNSGSLENELFFLIHINTFCFCPSSDRYYPAEIAVAGFSLRDGVLANNVFHSMIKSGPLPLGYAATALLQSNETHQIRPPMMDEMEDNTEDVFEKLIKFLSEKNPGSGRLPFLYAEEKNIKMIQHILDLWCIEFQVDQNPFKVFNLQYMFRVLKNETAKDTVWSSDTFSSREIEKDVYAYTPNIACKYHEIATSIVYCSKSIVIRFAYVICDNCCPDLELELVPGYHVPAATQNISRISRPASVASSRSSRAHSNLNDSSIRDDDSSSVISFSSKADTWETSSVTSETSTITTVENDDQFPILGGRPKRSQMSSPASWSNFTPNDASSQSSQRSYAGATGKTTAGLSRRQAALPSSMLNSVDHLSLNSQSQPYVERKADFASVGRGRAGGVFSGDANDFPVLGQGRGSSAPRGRGLRRPVNPEFSGTSVKNKNISDIQLHESGLNVSQD